MKVIHERTGSRDSLCGRVISSEANSSINDDEITCAICKKRREIRDRNNRCANRALELYKKHHTSPESQEEGQ